MALGTPSLNQLSDTRLNKITSRRTLVTNIERASTIVFNSKQASMVAGDYPLGIAPYDMELVKAYVEWEGDEGTNGTVAIEKWDDVSGTAQSAMTDSVTVDGGAAAIYALTPNSDGTEKIVAGEKLNMLIATCDGVVAGTVTLAFKLVDDVDSS